MRRRYFKRAIAAPCPGCGEKEKHRLSAEVCDDCKRTLSMARQLERLVRGRVKAGEVIVRIPEVQWAHELPYVSHQLYGSDVRTALVALAHAVGERISARTNEHSIGYSDETTPVEGTKLNTDTPLIEGTSTFNVPAFLMPSKEVADAFEALYTAIQKVAVDAYNEGVDDGRNLLMQMHSGEITLADFEERILPEKFDAKRARRR